MTDTHDHSRVAVRFPLTPDAVGWPPVAGETLWARRVGRDLYRIENAPWFVGGIAVGDIVRAAVTKPGGVLEYVATVTSSDHATVRLIVADGHSLEQAAAEIRDCGTWVEGDGHWRMLAVDVPPDAAVHVLAELLSFGASEGRWGWEEGKLSEPWVTAVRKL